MAATYHQLGMTSQQRGRLDEAEDWYRKSLAIKDELGNRPGKVLTLAQLGMLEVEQGHPHKALERAVRCVTLFDEFPHPMTGTGPGDLVRLTAYLGMDALEAAWPRVRATPCRKPSVIT